MVPNVLSRCHTKRMVDVPGRAHPSFGMTPNIFFLILDFSFFFGTVGVIPKEGWAQPRMHLSFSWYDNDSGF